MSLTKASWRCIDPLNSWWSPILLLSRVLASLICDSVMQLVLVTVPLFSWVLWRKTTAALAGEDSARAHVLIRLRGWWLIRVLVLLVFIQIRLLGFRLLMVVGVGDSSLAVLAHWNVLLSTVQTV